MKPFEKCPVCAGALVTKDVEKIVRGGTDTAVIRVEAEVCLRCGERLYSEETVRRFEDIRRKLERRDTTGLKRLGRSFQVT
jgi:YgiT-type zinc finger domain-containing protein